MFLSWIVAIWVRLTKFIEEKEPKVLEVRGSNNKNEIYNNYNNKKIKKKKLDSGEPRLFWLPPGFVPILI